MRRALLALLAVSIVAALGILGTTGNLRAPLVRAGDTTLVGFNEDAWSETLL